MKSLRLPLFAAALLLVSSLSAQTPEPRVNSTGGRSPHETTSTVIGDRRTGNRITITYGRPFSKDPRTGETRKIWGTLIPWDQPNRLGADEATLLLTQKPLVFGNTTIPAGAHTLYLVPSENGTSFLAFSSNLGKWGVPVDTAHDIARIPLEKSSLDQSVDQLTIRIENDPTTGGGAIKIAWENTQFSAPFTVAK